MSKLSGETFGRLYERGVGITEEVEARAFFEETVQLTLKQYPRFSREMAETSVKTNLRYYASFHSNDIQARVERLFMNRRRSFWERIAEEAGTPHALEAACS